MTIKINYFLKSSFDGYVGLFYELELHVLDNLVHYPLKKIITITTFK